MAPVRKTTSVNKRISLGASPDKDVGKSSKNKQTRRFSDKLGPQWRKGEVRRFYEAYRKHGKNWKKVAVAVRYRSVEMVEALYNMNRAYLSLPEGTASVVGLIAMMTDHYNAMEESDGGHASDDAIEISHKPQKRKWAKLNVASSKENALRSHSNGSAEGCLFYLRGGHIGKVLGTMALQFPNQTFLELKVTGQLVMQIMMSNSYKIVGFAFNIGGQPRVVRRRTPRVDVQKENVDSSNKRARTLEVDNVAHGAALALSEAFQSEESSQVLSSPNERTGHRKSPPVRRWDKMIEKSEAAQGRIQDKEPLDGNLRGRKLENGVHVRNKMSSINMEDAGTGKVHRKGNKSYGKRTQVEEKRNNHSDDDREACSGTQGVNGTALNGFDSEVSNAEIAKYCPEAERKNDMFALLELADVSARESESSLKLKKEQNTSDKRRVPEFTSTVQHRDKVKPIGTKGRQHTTATVEGPTLRMPKIAPCSPIVSEVKQNSQLTSSPTKRKRKSSISMPQASNTQAHRDVHPKQVMGKASTEEENKSSIKDKRARQVYSPLQQWRPDEFFALSSIDDDQKILPTFDAQVPATTLDIPAKQPNRRKIDLKRRLNSEKKVSDNMVKSSAPKYPVSALDGVPCLKEKLSSCLSTPLRRWCMYEWFYSAIDYPWFAKQEFDEYLKHVGLGDIPRLTRVEWGVIRSSLGKPRRFSEHFLNEEREKLQKYRETVRKTYSDLRAGVREGVPTDLAHPLSVGQRVAAFNPKTREIHDGTILTVDHDKCRVQFDRPDLGVGLVMDIDCMPLNPRDKLPEAIRRQNIAAHKLQMPKEPQGQSNVELSNNTAILLCLPSLDISHLMDNTNHAISWNRVTSQQQAFSTPMLTREADTRAISNVNRANIKRDALLVEPQLNPRCTGLEKSAHPWIQPSATTSLFGGLPYSVNGRLFPQEAGSRVLDIVKGSRLKAHSMVDTAIQTLSTMKEGEDAFAKIEEALNQGQYVSGPKFPGSRSQEQANGVVGPHNQLLSGALEQMCTNSDGSGNGQQKDYKNETEIPSELIASCVSTLLMIQSCTERQYPPAEVAQIIDCAVMSLHPHCPQNLPLFREIQMCMGRVKTQILALVPT
ncbi:hypothetical protein ACFE04_027103 [Oxalis oulophora]